MCDAFFEGFLVLYLVVRRAVQPSLLPTRRSSDLPSGFALRVWAWAIFLSLSFAGPVRAAGFKALIFSATKLRDKNIDRKSTRLNSSHRTISYAVFCLKKKKSRFRGPS